MRAVKPGGGGSCRKNGTARRGAHEGLFGNWRRRLRGKRAPLRAGWFAPARRDSTEPRRSQPAGLTGTRRCSAASRSPLSTERRCGGPGLFPKAGGKLRKYGPVRVVPHWISGVKWGESSNSLVGLIAELRADETFVKQFRLRVALASLGARCWHGGYGCTLRGRRCRKVCAAADIDDEHFSVPAWNNGHGSGRQALGVAVREANRA